MDIAKMIQEMWDGIETYTDYYPYIEDRLKLIELTFKNELQKIKDKKLVDGRGIDIDEMIIPLYAETKDQHSIKFRLKLRLINLALEFNESELYKDINYQSRLVMERLTGE